jgi:hypothetical protein
MEHTENTPRRSIKRFIEAWIGGLLVCIVGLAVLGVIGTDSLQDMNAKLFEDSTDLESAYRLENSILAEREEDILWRKTNESIYLTKKTNELRTTDEVIGELIQGSNEPEER